MDPGTPTKLAQIERTPNDHVVPNTDHKSHRQPPLTIPAFLPLQFGTRDAIKVWWKSKLSFLLSARDMNNLLDFARAGVGCFDRLNHRHSIGSSLTDRADY